MFSVRLAGLGSFCLLLACGAGGPEFIAGSPSGPGGEGGGTAIASVSGMGGMSEGSAGEASTMAEAGAGAQEDSCTGVTCESPPANSCESSTEFRSYDTIGSCADGVCRYVSHQIACACRNSSCETDACLGVACNSPPAAACTGANGDTQTTYASTGSCSDGSCSYTPTDQACRFGCAKGACKPDPCADVSCNVQRPAQCKDADTKTSYAATGTCSAGSCSYKATDTDCLSNESCVGAGVCATCKTESSCGPSCTACAGGTPKCKDLGATSKCVACLSNADCSGATPVCNTTTSICQARPSCSGLPATCGPSGSADCCASNFVAGGTFNRSNDADYPATVANFRLDTYEITVGRFRKFVAAYSQTMTPSGAGKNPNNVSDPGWDSAWNASLAATASALKTAVKCSSTYQTWTDTPGMAAAESLPMNCMDWFEAEAFCIWDGGRLPTEAEWNYAAAGGGAQRTYPWGSPPPDCNYANFVNVDYCVLPGTGRVSRVGYASPKGDGVYGQADLAGNVSEWVQDWYVNPYPKPCDNCASTATPSGRVLRGGSFGDAASGILNSYRSSDAVAYHAPWYGARCARNP